MIKESDKRREEIAELKARIEKLEREFDYEGKEDYYEEGEIPVKSLSKKEKKKYTRILVVLVVILLIMDVIALMVYFKPDFLSVFKPKGNDAGNNANINSSGTAAKGFCNDGTPEGQCSRNKPYYCYEGSLVKKAVGCGCPSGYVVDFQDCVKRG